MTVLGFTLLFPESNCSCIRFRRASALIPAFGSRLFAHAVIAELYDDSIRLDVFVSHFRIVPPFADRMPLPDAPRHLGARLTLPMRQ